MVAGRVVGEIGHGMLVLLGAGKEDTEETARHLARRIATLRIFSDSAGKMNLDLTAAGGAALVVSQFTLYADTSRGHRPSFIRAGEPTLASGLCDVFCDELRARGPLVATGEFGAHMEIDAVSDGPVTLVLSGGEPAWDADAG
jgi:D-tyrosyl-tRNA(Tyr) deacylase